MSTPGVTVTRPPHHHEATGPQTARASQLESTPTLDDLHTRIFARSCALSASCHGGSSPKEGFDLSSPDSTFSFVGKPSKQMPSLKLFDPGNPDGSYVLHELHGLGIATTSSSGVPATQMPPPPSAPLCAEKIAVISSWIRAGARRRARKAAR